MGTGLRSREAGGLLFSASRQVRDCAAQCEEEERVQRREEYKYSMGGRRRVRGGIAGLRSK